MKKVVIVNYGMGNTKSVIRGVEKAGAIAVLSGNPDVVRNAERVILPGVGAFEYGIKEIRQRELDHALNDFVKKDRPLFGICLGMQMLFDESEEHGKHQGLGFIHGKVVQIPQDENGAVKRKIPHIGWSALHFPEYHQNRNESVLDNNNEGTFFYFVHSFMVMPENKEHILAQCDYEGLAITASVRKDNIIGCQFHPEKSGRLGLNILERFLTL